jgi:hypothetical protein
VVFGVKVDPAADLRRPQLDAVVLEQRRHRGVLAAVEGPLVLADHDRVPPPVRIGQRSDQGRGLRAARPSQRPAVSGVEELGYDPPVSGRQRGGLVLLPRS